MLCLQSTAADCKDLALRIELELLVLDEEPSQVTVVVEGGYDTGSETDTFSTRPPEHGALVAMEMDCSRTGPDSCQPRRPRAVLTTVEGLKRFIEGLPAGTRVEWNPGCLGPWPREHPLSGSGASEEIEAFAARHRVKFVIHKAG